MFAFFELDFAPELHGGVEDFDFGAFVDEEEVGTAVVRRTLDRDGRSNDNGIVAFGKSTTLRVSGKIGKDDEDKHKHGSIHTNLTDKKLRDKHIGKNATKHKDETYDSHNRPCMTAHGVAEVVPPSDEEHLGWRSDLVDCLATSKGKIGTDITISRFEKESTFVVEDGKRDIIELVVGIT